MADIRLNVKDSNGNAIVGTDVTFNLGNQIGSITRTTDSDGKVQVSAEDVIKCLIESVIGYVNTSTDVFVSVDDVQFTKFNHLRIFENLNIRAFEEKIVR